MKDSRSGFARVGKSCSSNTAFHRMPYRSDCRTSWPHRCSVCDETSTSCRVSDVGSGCAWTIRTFFIDLALRLGVADSIGCPLLSVKSPICSATIQRMDTRRLDLNLLVTLEALLAERNVTKAAA